MLRRVRGLVLRLVRRRMVAVVAGLALVLPAAWVEIRGVDAWWASGAALIFGATGAALLWTGVTGVPPDFIDSDQS